MIYHKRYSVEKCDVQGIESDIDVVLILLIVVLIPMNVFLFTPLLVQKTPLQYQAARQQVFE